MTFFHAPKIENLNCADHASGQSFQEDAAVPI